MNNVWTAIAFRAPCAARQIPRKPLLQLFNGYARSLSTRNGRSVALQPPPVIPSKISFNAFTTSAILSAKGKTRKPPTKSTKKAKAKPTNSKLEAASTVASHTEGPVQPSEPEALTWRDYDPVGGMPLPDGELSQPQLNAVFNSEELDIDTGNYVLSVMYWRRMSGALIDEGLEFPKDNGVNREQALKALEYLRSLDPQFDEEAAGQVWIGEETLRLQEQLRDRAVQIGLYKAEEPEEGQRQDEYEESDQGTEYGRSRNQDSQLLRLRQENIARNKREEAAQKAKQEAEELAAFRKYRGPLELVGGVQPPSGIAKHSPTGIVIRPTQSDGWLQPVERKEWVKRYEENAEIIKDDKAPEMSLLQRLGPSFLMMLATLAIAYWVSENYTPPPKSARMFPDTPPAVATLAVLTGTLVTGFIVCRFPPMWRFMNKYMTLVPAYPYALSILGAAFRHQPATHLLTNAVSLCVFGLILHEDVGRGTFLSIFFAAGAVGGFSTLTYHVLRRSFDTYIFGSSSCVLGVMAAACVLRPNGTMKIMGYEVPIATWLFLAGFSVMQVVIATRGLMPGIDHVGHFGGLIVGFVSAMLLREKAKRERRAIEEGETVSAVAEAENNATVH